MAQKNPSTEKKIIDLDSRLVVAKGEGLGWTGNFQTIAFGMDKQ